jgi:hypothetical protein
MNKSEDDDGWETTSSHQETISDNNSENYSNSQSNSETDSYDSEYDSSSSYSYESTLSADKDFIYYFKKKHYS